MPDVGKLNMHASSVNGKTMMEKPIKFGTCVCMKHNFIREKTLKLNLAAALQRGCDF